MNLIPAPPITHRPLNQSARIIRDANSKADCGQHGNANSKANCGQHGNANSKADFKDRIHLSLRSRIVYKYKCQCYNALYVGETVRHFHKRISEHMGISAFTGKRLSKPPFSNIRDHHQASGHPISPDDFSVLSTCSSSFKLL